MNISRLEDLWLTARGIGVASTWMRSSENWTPERMDRHQFLLLRRLLVESGRHVPYYRDLFGQLDFRPERDFLRLEDLARLPVLTKEAAGKAGGRLLHATEAQGALELRSSGSTGEPFRIRVSRSHWVIEQAAVWRHWRWAGYRFRDRMAIIRSYVPGEGQPLWKLDRTRNFLYFSAYHLTSEVARSYLEELVRWKPAYLRGYPSSLHLLARAALDSGMRLPGVKGVLTASETLIPAYRETIERAFGPCVFDWYGQSEETVTFNECEAHDGLHLNPEYGYCELLPDPSLAPDERRIVATCLRNLAQPLIRYETGDVALVGPERDCACGRKLPRIRAIRGRKDDFLYAGDGRPVPSVNFYTLFYDFDEIRGFQLVQDDVSALEVRLDLRAPMTEEVSARLRQALRERLGDRLQVRIVHDRPFERTADGKKRVVISRVGARP